MQQQQAKWQQITFVKHHSEKLATKKDWLMLTRRDTEVMESLPTCTQMPPASLQQC